MIVIFDFDGPILDVSERYYQLYIDLLQTACSRPLSKEAYWGLKRARVSELAIFEKSGVTGEIDKLLNERLSRIESLDYLRYDRVQTGIVETLEVLSRRHELVLATLRRSRENLEWQLAKLGLDTVFSEVLSSPSDVSESDYAQVKVDLVRRRFGRNELQGWFIGDTTTDIKTGQALGLGTIAVSYGIRTSEELEKCQPTLLFETPQQLQSFFLELSTGEDDIDGIQK